MPLPDIQIALWGLFPRNITRPVYSGYSLLSKIWVGRGDQWGSRWLDQRHREESARPKGVFLEHSARKSRPGPGSWHDGLHLDPTAVFGIGRGVPRAIGNRENPHPALFVLANFSSKVEGCRRFLWLSLSFCLFQDWTTPMEDDSNFEGIWRMDSEKIRWPMACSR